MISFPIQPELPQKRQEVLEIILRLEKIDTVIELRITVLGFPIGKKKVLTGVILHPLEGVSEPFGVHFSKFYYVG